MSNIISAQIANQSYKFFDCGVVICDIDKKIRNAIDNGKEKVIFYFSTDSKCKMEKIREMLFYNGYYVSYSIENVDANDIMLVKLIIRYDDKHFNYVSKINTYREFKRSRKVLLEKFNNKYLFYFILICLLLVVTVKFCLIY